MATHAQAVRSTESGPAEPSVPSAVVARGSGPRQARYWFATLARESWEPCLPQGAQWCTGQPELGEGGYRHWQLIVSFSTPKSRVQVSSAFFPGGPPAGLSVFFEPTRSAAAERYVHKDDSRDGEPFEFGSRPFHRNSAKDWDEIKAQAKAGQLDLIPSDVFIRYYASLRRIAGDFAKPTAILRKIQVFHGPTGTGKSEGPGTKDFWGVGLVTLKNPGINFCSG